MYEALEASDVSWYCCNCGIPNFNTSLFEDFLPSSSDSLHTSRSSESSDGSVLDTSNIGLPISTSFPTSRKRQPLSKRKLRIVSINFQSLRSKKAAFWSMLEYTDPDIILASETWLYLPRYYRERTTSRQLQICCTERQKERSTWRCSDHCKG